MANPMERNDEHALRVFHDDFRRALLMHRKGRLRLFCKLMFPSEESLLDSDVSLLEQLDFRVWLGNEPPPHEAYYLLYQELTHQQDALLLLAKAALVACVEKRFTAAQFAVMSQSMLDLDRLANRLVSSYTNALTDVDRLTGLLNRSAMERDLSQEFELSVQKALPFSVAMLDLDHFKQVNDQHGHPMGDLVLQVLAERFSESLRPRDRVYRYGGEEFLVMLPETSLPDALPLLERLRHKACASPVQGSDVTLKQTVSIGVAQVDLTVPYTKAIESADQALYAAKRAGRNQIVCARS